MATKEEKTKSKKTLPVWLRICCLIIVFGAV